MYIIKVLKIYSIFAKTICMTTKTLKILECSNEYYITAKCHRYSAAFIYVYNAANKSSDKSFEEKVCERFKLNSIEFDSVCRMAKSFINKEISEKKNKEDAIVTYRKQLKEANLNKYQKYVTYKRINKYANSAGKRASFGGAGRQKALTKSSYTKDSNLEKDRASYKAHRVYPFCIIGESNQKGNRFYDFSQLHNGIITYKPKKGIKIEIRVKIPKSYEAEMLKLQRLAVNKQISITVRLDTNFIRLTYDNEALYGYAFDKKSLNENVSPIRKDASLTDKQKKDLISEKYAQAYSDWRNMKMSGKIKDRCMAIDMNPGIIGYSVIQKDTNSDTGHSIIEAGMFDLSYFSENLHLSNTDYRKKHKNNKRKYELTIVLKKIFSIARHYKCSCFALEEFNFKVTDRRYQEANRKIFTLWNRVLTIQIIERNCQNNGIELIYVNPLYSSFIGNIMYNYVDPINASIEIGRRALYKYNKGKSLYPIIRDVDMRTVYSLFDGVAASLKKEQGKSVLTWIKIHRLSQSLFQSKTDFEHRWRASFSTIPKDRYEKLSVCSLKSKVVHYRFKN